MPTVRKYRFASSVVLLLGVWLAALLGGGIELGLDRALYRALYAGGNETAIAAAKLLSLIGRYYVLVPVGIAAAVYLAFRRRRRAALLLIILFGGRLLVELQKLIFARPRPILTDHLDAVGSLSFPSGHAANSMITLVAIALLLPVGTRWRAAGVAAAGVLTLLIGLSRVMLGVHWPSDVVGGWAFGLLWILLLMRLASTREPAAASPN